MINPLAYLTSPEGSRNTHTKRKVIGQRHMSIPKELKNLLPFKVIIK